MNLLIWLSRLKMLRNTLFSLLLVFTSSAGAQQASLNGNVINLPAVTLADQVFQVELTIVEGSNPVELLLTDAVELTDANTDGASSFDGELLSIPSIYVDGVNYWANLSLLSADPPRFLLADVGTVVANPPPINCTRPEPDLSNGSDDPLLFDGFLVPPSEIFDGGPGPDGIPAINSPLFTQNFREVDIQPEDMVIGVKIGDQARAYPHLFMDYHEIVNDRYVIDGASKNVTLSYCPLTGSAMLWESFADSSNSTFGVSGLLHNSNLILYDRETESLWAQMLEQAISGPEVGRIPAKLQVLETTWQTWQELYPHTLLLKVELNQYSFPYEFYPYGLYRSDASVLYQANNLEDTRLHRKERVLGINVGSSSKVYPVSGFAANTLVLNDNVGGMDVVAAGSAGKNFAAVYNRQLEDCTVLEFSSIEGQLPVVMVDNEGNEWDVFGNAINGSRAGTQLQKTNSFIAYWFAWTAFYPGAEIYQ